MSVSRAGLSTVPRSQKCGRLVSVMQSSEQNIAIENEIKTLLPSYDWLATGFSERRHGNLRLGLHGEPIDVLARARFLLECGIAPDRIVSPILVHGATVREVGARDLEEPFEADGLVTAEPNVYLTVTSADCLPIYFVDGEHEVIGLCHAGWRGLLRGVVESTVVALEGLGAKSNALSAAIGPCIHSCHFEVNLAVAKQFEKHIGGDVVAHHDGKLFVDLPRSAIRLLTRAGVATGNIKMSGECTFCAEKYFSYRRDGNNGVGIETMMAVIGIRKM